MGSSSSVPKTQKQAPSTDVAKEQNGDPLGTENQTATEGQDTEKQSPTQTKNEANEITTSEKNVISSTESRDVHRASPQEKDRNEDNHNKDTGEASNESVNNEGNGGTEKEDNTSEDREDITSEDDENDSETTLNENDLEKTKESIINNLNHAIDKVNTLEKYQDDNGNYHREVRKVAVMAHNAYYGLNSAKLADKTSKFKHIGDLRQKICALSMRTGMVDLWCDMVMNGYSKHFDAGHEDPTFFVGHVALGILENYSDCLDEIAELITQKSGMLETIKQALEERADAHLKNKLMEEQNDFLGSFISLLHNCSMRESNIPRLWNLNLTDLLQRYLRSESKRMSLDSLACLAAIVNEEECKIINANKESVKYLLLCLKNGMADFELRRYDGWSCKECGLTVRLLARNDANKKLLVELGALELLVELVRTGNTEEKYEGLNAICYLLFDEYTRKHVIETETLGLRDLLVKERASDDKKIKRLADNALWTLGGERSQSGIARFRELGQRCISRAAESQTSGHVMISYQWADQQALIKIRERIKTTSLKVWMDIEQMGGSTMDSMAEAIEQAHVVLVCFSHKYKDSVNCRREASYASTLNKKIIPLKMERDYKLGFLCGDEFFYDFCGKYDFDGKMNDLLKALKLCFNDAPVQKMPEVAVVQRPVSPIDVVDSVPLSASVTKTTETAPMDRMEVVRQWTKADVDNWLQRCGLKSSKVSHLTGLEISVLMKINFESPDCFYRCLNDTLKIKDMLTLSKLVWALHDLIKQDA